MTTVEEREAALLAEAKAKGLAVRRIGPGVFDVGGLDYAPGNLIVVITVNLGDFRTSRRSGGVRKGRFGVRRWKTIGAWKTPAPAVQAASTFTKNPIPKGPKP